MDLAAQFDFVHKRIETACARVRRDSSTVSVLAVTKGHPPETVRAAAELGHRLFGESRVQEAKAKIGRCPSHLRWHMIGHLQTNKCRDAVHFFEMIQSVDSLALAQEIDKWAEKHSKRMPILLEVNVAGEATKFGYRPDSLLAEITELNALKRVEIHGLMTMAPWTPEAEKVRPVFRQLRELKLKCEEVLGATLPHLSMGMSNDFDVAIEEGATMVRLGTVLFGPRAQARKATASEDSR